MTYRGDKQEIPVHFRGKMKHSTVHETPITRRQVPTMKLTLPGKFAILNMIVFWLLLIAKLTAYPTITWAWVFAPFWLPLVIVLTIASGLATIMTLIDVSFAQDARIAAQEPSQEELALQAAQDALDLAAQGSNAASV
jgi:hypothetical protein